MYSCFLLLPLLLVVLIFLLASNGAMAINYTIPTKPVSMLRLARIQRHLDKINKSPVKSIESPDGDIIDCIPLHRQPALDHPLQKNHKIQTVAPPRPRLKAEEEEEEEEEPRSGAWQAWHHVAGQCPEGTVPIRRTTVDDVLRAKSMYHYGKKKMSAVVTTTIDDVGSVTHEHAVAYTANQAEMCGGSNHRGRQ